MGRKRKDYKQADGAGQEKGTKIFYIRRIGRGREEQKKQEGGGPEKEEWKGRKELKGSRRGRGYH